MKKFLKGLKNCGFNYIKYNYFNPHIIRNNNSHIYPWKGSILQINGTLVLNGDLEFNALKYKGSKAESYLAIASGATMTVNGNTRVNYGSTINVNPDANLTIGSLTSNVGINIQCREKIEIGTDCMLGRNVAIFDSAFHPTGMSIDAMETNSESVHIGNHVWIGAYAFVNKGSYIGDGSIVGSHGFIGGEIKPGTTIVKENDVPTLMGNMWSRSMMKEHLEQVEQYYTKNINAGRDINIDAVSKYYDTINNVLSNSFSNIIFVGQKELMTSHVLDSMSVLSVVTILENEFNIKIPYYEISAENFNSLEAMCGLVARVIHHDIDVNKREYTQIEQTNDDYAIEPQNTLIEYVKVHAENNPRKIAVISDEKEYSYSELYEKVQKYASYLASAGLKPTDRVVVKSIQSVEYIIVYLAIHYIGATITTVEKLTTNESIVELASEIDATTIICDNSDLIDEKMFIYIDSKNVCKDLANQPKKEENFPSKDDSADILFTTGTTGKSKGVELSHSAVIAGAENIAFGCEMTRNTVLVVPNPLSHSNAIKNMAACFITGCTFYVLDGISDLKAYFDALDYPYGKVATVLPPAAIRTIFQLAKDKLGSYINKLDYLMAATAPLPEPDRQVLRELLPNTRLYNHYGCSESSSICIYDFNKYAELKNCVGKAMPHSRAFFVDDNKKEIVSSPENIGLLAVEGDATMKGYFREPELTAEIKDGQIIYTKDMGYIDEDGFVYILGRNDDIINVGGLKVSPLDVEAAALSYAELADCICIGVSDEITGQALKLLVVPGDAFNLKDLQTILNQKLEGYKVPKQIEIVEKVERTYNGKLNRKAYK